MPDYLLAGLLKFCFLLKVYNAQGGPDEPNDSEVESGYGEEENKPADRGKNTAAVPNRQSPSDGPFPATMGNVAAEPDQEQRRSGRQRVPSTKAASMKTAQKRGAAQPKNKAVKAKKLIAISKIIETCEP